MKCSNLSVVFTVTLQYKSYHVNIFIASFPQPLHTTWVYNVFMQSIGTLFNTETIKEKKPINSERAWVISQFVEELNKLAGTKYQKDGKWFVVKEVKPSYVAWKLSHLKLVDVYYFLSECRQSKSGFSKCFYGALKSYPQGNWTKKTQGV